LNTKVSHLVVTVAELGKFRKVVNQLHQKENQKDMKSQASLRLMAGINEIRGLEK